MKQKSTFKVDKVEVAQTAESVGNFMEYWGFKSIHGRIWALIFLSENHISTPEIVDTLQVSKASVSIGINDLLEEKLIKSSGKIRNGAVTYSATENVGSVVRRVLKERELKLISDTEKNLMKLAKLSPKSIEEQNISKEKICLLYTSPSPRDQRGSRMPSSA